MFHLRSTNRSLANPSFWGRCVLLGMSDAFWLKKVLQLSLIVVVCLGMSLEGFAKCGSSNRQMIWRNATNAEIIRFENSFFVPQAASKTGIQSNVVEAMSHDSDRPCTSCHCKDEKQPTIPANSLISKTTKLPICPFSEIPVAVRKPLLDGSLADLLDTFLCPSLGLLERPPRVLCA